MTLAEWLQPIILATLLFLCAGILTTAYIVMKVMDVLIELINRRRGSQERD